MKIKDVFDQVYDQYISKPTTENRSKYTLYHNLSEKEVAKIASIQRVDKQYSKGGRLLTKRPIIYRPLIAKVSIEQGCTIIEFNSIGWLFSSRENLKKYTSKKETILNLNDAKCKYMDLFVQDCVNFSSYTILEFKERYGCLEKYDRMAAIQKNIIDACRVELKDRYNIDIERFEYISSFRRSDIHNTITFSIGGLKQIDKIIYKEKGVH